MATTPNFPGPIRTSNCSIATGDTSRTGPTNYGTLLTGATNYGSDVPRIIVKATAATAAGMIRFFEHDGTNWFLKLELDVTAVASPGVSTKAWQGIITFGASTFSVSTSVSGVTTMTIPGDPLKVGPARTLRVSTHNSESFHVTADVRDYTA